MYQHPVSQNAGGFISVLFTEFSEAGSDVMEGDDGGAGIESKTIVLADDHGWDTIDAVTFFTKGSIARVVETLTPRSSVNLLGYLERDTFARGSPVRIRLLDLRSV